MTWNNKIYINWKGNIRQGVYKQLDHRTNASVEIWDDVSQKIIDLYTKRLWKKLIVKEQELKENYVCIFRSQNGTHTP